jgi:hypothetical protein
MRLIVSRCVVACAMRHWSGSRVMAASLRSAARSRLPTELACCALQVFDADMVCRRNFFVDILAVMTDPHTALCLSPQAFDNIIQERDIFNNINLQFWEYWLPGAAAWGYIACTGARGCCLTCIYFQLRIPVYIMPRSSSRSSSP